MRRSGTTEGAREEDSLVQRFFSEDAEHATSSLRPLKRLRARLDDDAWAAPPPPQAAAEAASAAASRRPPVPLIVPPKDFSRAGLRQQHRELMGDAQWTSEQQALPNNEAGAARKAKNWVGQLLGAKHKFVGKPVLLDEDGTKVLHRGNAVEQLAVDLVSCPGVQVSTILRLEHLQVGRFFFRPQGHKVYEVNDTGLITFFVDKAPPQGLIVQLRMLETYELYTGDAFFVPYGLDFQMINPSPSLPAIVTYVATKNQGSLNDDVDHQALLMSMAREPHLPSSSHAGGADEEGGYAAPRRATRSSGYDDDNDDDLMAVPPVRRYQRKSRVIHDDDEGGNDNGDRDDVAAATGAEY